MGLQYSSRFYFFCVGLMLFQCSTGCPPKIDHEDIACDGTHVNLKKGIYCFTFKHTLSMILIQYTLFNLVTKCTYVTINVHT